MAGKDQLKYQVARTDLGGEKRLAELAVAALDPLGTALSLEIQPLPPFGPTVPSTLSEIRVSARRQTDIARFLDVFQVGRDETTRRLQEESHHFAQEVAELRAQDPHASVLPLIVAGRSQLEQRNAAVEEVIFARAQLLLSGEVRPDSLQSRARRARDGESNIHNWQFRDLRRCRQG